jgi:hypothetical protein
VRASRTWTGLAGSGRTALIDHRDAAEAGLQLLIDPALWGAHHDLTGPQRMSWPEALELLSAELGVPVTFRVATEFRRADARVRGEMVHHELSGLSLTSTRRANALVRGSGERIEALGEVAVVAGSRRRRLTTRSGRDDPLDQIAGERRVADHVEGVDGDAVVEREEEVGRGPP